MSRKPSISIRRPPKPDKASVEEFVRKGEERSGAQTPKHLDAQKSEPPDIQTSEHSGVQTSKRSDVQTSAESSSIVKRRGGRVRRRMTLYFPPDLATKLKLHCVANEREMSDTVAEAVRQFLAHEG